MIAVLVHNAATCILLYLCLFDGLMNVILSTSTLP